MTFYRDNGRSYLELHAMRAPVGHYKPEYQNNSDRYDSDVHFAIEDFEQNHDVQLFTLGRSGRHICIEDTPANRKRYYALQTAAIAAARELWASMRTV